MSSVAPVYKNKTTNMYGTYIVHHTVISRANRPCVKASPYKAMILAFTGEFAPGKYSSLPFLTIATTVFSRACPPPLPWKSCSRCYVRCYKRAIALEITICYGMVTCSGDYDIHVHVLRYSNLLGRIRYRPRSIRCRRFPSNESTRTRSTPIRLKKNIKIKLPYSLV